MPTPKKKVGRKLNYYSRDQPYTDFADPKGDNPKAGADIGKIVNLMAGDANRCAMTVSAMYFIYGGMTVLSCRWSGR